MPTKNKTLIRIIQAIVILNAIGVSSYLIYKNQMRKKQERGRNLLHLVGTKTTPYIAPVQSDDLQNETKVSSNEENSNSLTTLDSILKSKRKKADFIPLKSVKSISYRLNDKTSTHNIDSLSNKEFKNFLKLYDDIAAGDSFIATSKSGLILPSHQNSQAITFTFFSSTHWTERSTRHEQSLDFKTLRRKILSLHQATQDTFIHSSKAMDFSDLDDLLPSQDFND